MCWNSGPTIHYVPNWYEEISSCIQRIKCTIYLFHMKRNSQELYYYSVSEIAEVEGKISLMAGWFHYVLTQQLDYAVCSQLIQRHILVHLVDEVYHRLISYEKEYARAVLICTRNKIGGGQTSIMAIWFHYVIKQGSDYALCTKLIWSNLLMHLEDEVYYRLIPYGKE